MRKSWVSVLGVVSLLCVALVAGPASAWEFTMTGNFSWEYKLYSQQGHNGFFGQYNVDNAGASDAASVNGWLGNEIMGTALATGTDVAASTMYMTVNPEIRLNEAVRIRGSYYVGSWQQTAAGAVTAFGSLNGLEYFNNTLAGSQNAFAPGAWNNLWATMQTPWGVLVFGKRPFSFGNGLLLNGEDNTSYEGILLVAPYGPLRFGAAWYPWRQGAGYTALADKNGMREVHAGGFVTYEEGSLSCGVLTEYIRWHTGPESQVSAAAGSAAGTVQTARTNFITADTSIVDGTAFMKYFNGRFFFNAEAAFFDLITKRQRNASGLDNVTKPAGYGSDFAPSYTPHQRYMIEMGAVGGPAKLSLLWSWINGPDRRHGVLIDRNPDLRWLTQLSNFSVFRPYSILFSWNYGSGNQSLTAWNGPGSDNGYVTDANVLAARFDYAVAANLNTYASFLWADRVSHGYGWGYIGPGLTALSVPTGNIKYADTAAVAPGVAAPSIPDSNLGWEVNAGFDWQLLEGFTLKTAFGYWQPGKWFNYACLDKGNPGWKAPTAGTLWGINPNRQIAPIYGMDVVMSVDF